MKFGKQLAAQQVPVWAPFYIDYKGLKKIINSLAKGRPADAALLAAGFRPPFNAANAHGDPSSTLSNTIPVLEDAPVPFSDSNTSEIHAAATNAASNSSQPSFLPDNGESALLQAHRAAFFFKLERELEKINAFYLQKEAEMKSRMRALIDKRKTVQARLAGTLSRESAAFIALYEGLRYFERDLGKLQNYIEMNATGFRKILKKWDKRSKSTTKELYLARQVDVQPCFNRDVISELSDTASANVRKLEGLCIAKGGEQTLDPAADGILSERRAELAVANAEAQDDLLSNIENELLNAVKANDRSAVQNILASIPPLENLDKEMQSQLARIYWRAAIADQPGERAALDIARLDFQFVDDINGRTPLIEAAARGKENLVRLCLERKVDIRHRDAYGREALHYAAMCSAEVCRCLIQHGTEANTVDYDGSTPLIHAISTGQLQCVEVLLSSLRDDPARSDSAQPMALAARLGHLPIVSLLLDNGYKMLPDASGYLPQHIAAKEGHVQVLQKLIEAGASVNAPDKFANWTPLFHAANEGHHQCVRVLLHAGADLRAVDDQGKTAVHHAAWSGHPEIVSVLLAASSQKDAPNPTPKLSGGIAASRKRTVDDLSIEDSMDLDGDLIPDLSLPPPALPLRTYGHSYLDGKRCLVQLALGHPTTNAQSVPPIHFYRSDQLTSLKLVITSKSELHNVPHTIMLPLQDDAEVISMSVESLDNLTLELEVYPTFGSRLIGKAVCLPSIFSKIRGIEALTVPILDSHLNVIGELNFEMNAISHFNNVQLAIGGRLETYWKSVTSETPSKSKSWKAAAPVQDDLSFVTASSLTGEYVKLVVQVTRDGIPVTYPAWKLPIDIVDLHVSDVTWSQLSVMAEQAGRTLRTVPKAGSDSRLWYSALSNVIAPLQDVFQTCPPEVGLHIEVRYPTESDISRLGIRDMLDVNVVIDSILNVVYANALGNADRGMVRRMIFSSFSPVACGALNWKQPNYAVLFASYCGLSRSTPEGQLQAPHRTELDKRCTSIEGAVKFAKANNVLGLLLDATIMTQVPSLVENVKESGLLLGLFGNSAKALPHVDAWTATEGVLSARPRDNDYV